MTIYQSDLILIVRQNVAEKVNQFDLCHQLLNEEEEEKEEEEEEEEEEEHVLHLKIPLAHWSSYVIIRYTEWAIEWLWSKIAPIIQTPISDD